MAAALALEECLSTDVRSQLHQALKEISADPQQHRRVIAVVNQKGGAGKTTSTLTLAAIWAAWGLQVRVMDCDPQYGSATFWLPPQWPAGQAGHDLRAVFFEQATLDEATAPTMVPGLFLVPSDKTLGQVEFAHNEIPDVTSALRSALAESRQFPITLLDCRPSLGPLTVSALTAATEVLIPLGASGMDVPGLVELNESLRTIRRRLNPDLPVSAVVVCHDSDTLLSRDVRAQLDEDYPAAIRWRIRRSVRVEEAPFAHEPLTSFAPTIPPTQEYVGLAAEMLIRGTA